MRTLQENVVASRSEQERMHEALVASQARNEELNRINEELHKALQEREERAAGDRSAPPSPPRSFPMPSLIRSHPATFAEIRRRAVAHIAAESEVTEKRGNAAPAKPHTQARVHP